MKRLYNALLCIFLVVSLAVLVSAVSSVPEPVIEATESVVRILAEYSDGYATGSGFVIKSDNEETLIVTNYHVVEEEPYSISVWLGEEETVSATILAHTNQKDMCILRLAYPISLKPLAFSANGAKQGEAVYAVGFPGAADYLSDKEAHTSADATITDGIVSAVREATVSIYGTPTKILQINAAINAGNSGGPLFNVNGEVVGINTYGIDDSQGIFGAIDISELKVFMNDNAIEIPKAENSFPWWIVVAVVVLGIIIAFVIIIRKKMKRKKEDIKQVSLREYMKTKPAGMGIHDAVAMLLPVALQLRDMHNDGIAHLEVSPDSIFIRPNGAILNGTTSSEVNRYTSGFAAPEVYTGVSAGSLSDIYSFCAVLSYVTSGKQPVNSLSRSNDEEGISTAEQPNPFDEIVKTGMSLDPINRNASMQDIIIMLSTYNIQPFVNMATVVTKDAEAKNKTQKHRISPKIVIPVVAAALVVVLLGTYFGCYKGAKNSAENGEFDSADNLLFIPQITKLHDLELVEYISAGKKLDSRQYSEAKNMFAALAGYMNADELVLEADYRYAIQCADANNFSTAISVMETLSNSQYKDSKEKHLELQYRYGVYLLYEESDFPGADKVFAQLAEEGYTDAENKHKETQYLWAMSLVEDNDYIGAYEKLIDIWDYSGVNDVLKTLREVIYEEGQRLYYEDKFADARSRFDCISHYKDSEKYITLIEARSFHGQYKYKYTVERLIDIFYFEDASELLLATDTVGTHFLLGTWRGDGYYFTMEEDDSISYNLPWFDYGDYYRIEDGKFLLYPKNNENKTKTLFQFTAISPDCIKVFCYKDSKTYTLYRQ